MKSDDCRGSDSCVIPFMFSVNSDSVISREQGWWRFGERGPEVCDGWRGFLDSELLKHASWNNGARTGGSCQRLDG